MAADGVSSLGVKFGWATGEVGTIPSAFTQLTRISSIGEINLDVETIDVSALEDYESKFTEGRADTGGSCSVVVNMTDTTIGEWNKVIEEYGKLSGTNDMYFTVWHPQLAKAFYFRAGVPKKLNMPAMDQNAAVTMTIELIIHEYIGLDDAAEKEPTPSV